MLSSTRVSSYGLGSATSAGGGFGIEAPRVSADAAQAHRHELAPRTAGDGSARTRVVLTHRIVEAEPAIELDDIRPVVEATVQSPTVAESVSPADPASVAMAPRRQAFLDQINSDKARKRERMNPVRLLDAIKLRRLEEDHYDKDKLSKATPRFVAHRQTKTAAFTALHGKGFATIRGELAAQDATSGRSSSRSTQLELLSLFAYVEGLGIDPQSFMSGDIRKNIRWTGATWEQRHTLLGRLVTDVAMGTAFGLEFLPIGASEHVGNALHHAKEHGEALMRTVVDNLCSALPTFAINPVLTGATRSMTDALQKFRFKHGFPALSGGLAAAGDLDASSMQTSRERLKEKRDAIECLVFRGEGEPAISRLAALAPDKQALVRESIGRSYAMYDIANDAFKRSLGAGTASMDGKVAGAIVHGMGTTVTMLSFAQRYDLALAMALVTTAAQPFSGAYDLSSMATSYMEAGLKWDWQSLIKPEFRRLPIDALKTEHLDLDEAANRWDTQPEIRIKAVREVYENKLAHRAAEFDRTLDRLDTLLGKQDRAATPSRQALIAEQGAKLLEQCVELEAWRQDIARFESFDATQWAQISPGRLGRYTDRVYVGRKQPQPPRPQTTGKEPRSLSMSQLLARVDKPGEVLSQVNQRLKQLAQDGPLSYMALYAAAKGLQALGVPPGVGEALLVVGALNWTGLTFQTRGDKAKEKKLFASPFGDASEVAQDRRHARVADRIGAELDTLLGGESGTFDTVHQRVEAAGRWDYTAAGKSKPLTGEAGYRRTRPGGVEHVRRLGQAWKTSAFSEAKALRRYVKARGERQRCADELRALVAAFEAAGFASTPGPMPTKSKSLAGVRARFEEFDVVAEWRRGEGSEAVMDTFTAS